MAAWPAPWWTRARSSSTAANNTNDMDGSMSVYTPSYAGDPTGGAANQSNGVAAGATGVMPTPADSVEEFKVNVAGQGADFNSSAGAQVQIVTKRGTQPVARHGLRVLPRQQPERQHLAEQFQRHPESELPLQPFRRRHRRPDHPQEDSGRQDLLLCQLRGLPLSPTPRPSNGQFHRRRCGSGLLAVQRSGLQPESHARDL